MKQTNSNVKVNVIDNRKNGGNYKWQIEKLDVILDFFNNDFFNDYPNVKIEVIVNNKEVFPKMIVDGVAVFPDYIRYFKAFSKSKKEMVEEMNYMVEMMNNMVNNNNMEENNMNDMAKKMEMIVMTEFNFYVKEVLVNDFEVAIDDAENEADDFGDDENEHYCSCFTLNNYDIRKMWADWACENNVMSRDDAYVYYDDNRELFIDIDDMYGFLNNFYGHYIDTEDDGVVYFYVVNPNFVEQEQVENDSPFLNDVERVVKVIKDYVINYEGMLMDYDGNSASICVPWDVFNEDDMKMLIEDRDMYKCVGYALMVDGVPLREILVYDDGVYVSVDVKMFDKVA